MARRDNRRGYVRVCVQRCGWDEGQRKPQVFLPFVRPLPQIASQISTAVHSPSARGHGCRRRPASKTTPPRPCRRTLPATSVATSSSRSLGRTACGWQGQSDAKSRASLAKKKPQPPDFRDQRRKAGSRGARFFVVVLRPSTRVVRLAGPKVCGRRCALLCTPCVPRESFIQCTVAYSVHSHSTTPGTGW